MNDMKRWWDGRELVNGVFKGGGARGIAYAGALHAVSDAGLWFGAVAGSSAGALTAALIAGGLTPEQIEAETARGLGSLMTSRAMTTLLLPVGPSLLDSTDLRIWICDAIGNKEDVTFDQMYRRTGTSLYVVTMDLATTQPVIFNHIRYPHVSVASAVVASCAIPGVLPPGRVDVDSGSQMEVHRLVDGGAWANYPDFVFGDDRFRSWYFSGIDRPTDFEIPVHDEVAAATLGFVLDDQQSDPVRAVRFRRDRYSSSDRGHGATGRSTVAFVAHRAAATVRARVAAVASVVVLLGLMVNVTGLVGPAVTGTLRGGPLGGPTAFVVVAVLALAITIVMAILLASAVFGRVLTESVIPAATAATAPATAVRPWVFVERSKHHAVLTVPSSGLKTLNFAAGATKRQAVVDRAYSAIADDLESIGYGVTRHREIASSAVTIEPPPTRPHRWVLGGLIQAAGWTSIVIGATTAIQPRSARFVPRMRAAQTFGLLAFFLGCVVLGIACAHWPRRFHWHQRLAGFASAIAVAIAEFGVWLLFAGTYFSVWLLIGIGVLCLAIGTAVARRPLSVASRRGLGASLALGAFGVATCVTAISLFVHWHDDSYARSGPAVVQSAARSAEFDGDNTYMMQRAEAGEIVQVRSPEDLRVNSVVGIGQNSTRRWSVQPDVHSGRLPVGILLLIAGQWMLAVAIAGRPRRRQRE